MNEFNESEIQPVSEINTAEKQTIQQSNPEWDEIILKAYDGLPDEFKLAAQNFKVANGKTGVLVTYMPFPGPPIGVCHVTIYTATGPRHPVSAEVEQMIPGGWKPLGYRSINNYAVGTKSSIAPEITKFIFDCRLRSNTGKSISRLPSTARFRIIWTV